MGLFGLLCVHCSGMLLLMCLRFYIDCWITCVGFAGDVLDFVWCLRFVVCEYLRNFVFWYLI